LFKTLNPFKSFKTRSAVPDVPLVSTRSNCLLSLGQRRLAGDRCRTYEHEKRGHQIVLGSPSEEVIIDSTHRAADEKISLTLVENQPLLGLCSCATIR
jgi:hypothetical protein